jgi:hypothetical protein
LGNSRTVGDARDKIRSWLTEERLSPEDVQNAGAYYTFKVNVYGTMMFVVHSSQFVDSVSVSASFDLTGEKDQRILQSMDERKRQEFLRDLSLSLLANNGIWYHLIRPNPPSEMKIFELASRRIYYETMTKEKLMNAILDVRNASGIFTCLFERYATQISYPRQEVRASFIG